MHELSLADDVIQIVTEQLGEAELKAVKTVRVAVGEMMMVEKDTFIFAFDALKEETPLKNAALEIVSIPLRAACGTCGHQFEPEKRHPRCPECGGKDYAITEGNSMFVREVEIE